MTESSLQPSREAFLLFCQGLVALSLSLFLGWQVKDSLRQRGQLRLLVEQQEPLVNQAAQVEASFKSMVAELVALSASDADARAIVAKYGISMSPAPGVTEGAGGAKRERDRP